MAQREETRNLETIPVGSLGIIPLEGCRSLGEKVNDYLVKWRTVRESEHKTAWPLPAISATPISYRPRFPVLVPERQRELF